MTPITDLTQLIKGMDPVLTDQQWYYCSVDDIQPYQHLLQHTFAMINETESVTLILPPEHAELIGQHTTAAFRRIELQVFSSLEAVGLTAVISQCLREQNISANVVAGYHHDHIFVPEKDADKAIAALNLLTAENS